MEKRSGLVLFTGGLLLPRVPSMYWAHVADLVNVIEHPMHVESHQATQKGQGVITAHPVPTV